jgi:hypothetical protein
MWNSTKSVILSLICTRIAIVLVFAVAIALPLVPWDDYAGAGLYVANLSEYMTLIIVVMLLCCVAALAALFSLDRLLSNIRKEEVFTEKNVRLLRIISWACFAVAIAMFVGCIASVSFFVIGILACFVGLILRVVKNVISAAVALKDENDFTI